MEELHAAPSIEADSRINAIAGGANSRHECCSMGDTKRPGISQRFPVERIRHHGLRLMLPGGCDLWCARQCHPILEPEDADGHQHDNLGFYGLPVIHRGVG